MNVLDICESLLEVQDLDQYHRTLALAAHALSCDTFGGFFMQEGNAAAGSTPRVQGFTNVPAGFQTYFAADAARRDPVMQLMKRSSLPLVWNKDTYVDAGRGDMWEEGASWGMASGMIVAMHLPGGKHFCLGIETSKQLKPGDPSCAADLADLSLIVAYAQAAAEKLVLDPETDQANPLSVREREVLAWSAAGKTAWETSRILSIAESTVTKHLDSAMKKMLCANKTHAVARAIQAGWLA